VVKREIKVKIRAKRRHLTRILIISPHKNTDEMAHKRRVITIISPP
jgi:hypothetical protein